VSADSCCVGNRLALPAPPAGAGVLYVLPLQHLSRISSVAQTRLRLAEIWFADDLNLVCAAFASPTITDINSEFQRKLCAAHRYRKDTAPRAVRAALRVLSCISMLVVTYSSRIVFAGPLPTRTHRASRLQLRLEVCFNLPRCFQSEALGDCYGRFKRGTGGLSLCRSPIEAQCPARSIRGGRSPCR
jgi:hypothetical protein